jgi:hypothetical protein
MDQKHPHAHARYAIVQQEDKTYGVEVRIAGMHPTTVTSFDSEANAGEWIDRHKKEVEAGPAPRRRFFTRSKSA